jgi:hypothetical protein
LEREVLEVHAPFVSMFVLPELVFDAAMMEAVSCLVTLLLRVSAGRLRDTRPHASAAVIFGTHSVQSLGLELQLLLLKVLQGALAFPVCSFDFFCLDLLEVLGILLSSFFGGLHNVEIPPLKLLKSGLVLRMQLVYLLFGLLPQGIFALFVLLLFVIELLPHLFVV